MAQICMYCSYLLSLRIRNIEEDMVKSAEEKKIMLYIDLFKMGNSSGLRYLSS